jgi:hypothetical protein
MAPSKEPTHFVDGEELKRVSRAIWQMGYWSDRAKYLGEFAAARDETILGESSTNYSKLPRVTGVAQRIADFNPDARIVYIMRDPIERTISHYWHNAKYHDERRNVLEAVRSEPHYREVSYYAMQIAPFLDVFGSEQVKTLTLEELRDDAPRVLRDLFAWLGVDPNHLPPNLERQNVTETEVVSAHTLVVLRQVRYWRHWHRVRRLIPRPVLSVGRWLAERRRDRSALDIGPAVDYLRPMQLAELRELTELLGRDFPEWTRLHGTARETATA